jgi:phage protein D
VFDAGQAIQFSSVYQKHESDLAFLKRLCKEYGLTLSLKAGKECLTMLIVDPGKPMGGIKYEINRTSETNFSFSEKAVRGAGGASTAYFDMDKKEKVSAAAPGGGEGHEIRTVGTGQAAGAHIQGAAADAKKNEEGNSLTLPGDPRLVASALVNLTGWGRNDGIWLIKESEHTLDVFGGYSTKIALRRQL